MIHDSNTIRILQLAALDLEAISSLSSNAQLMGAWSARDRSLNHQSVIKSNYTLSASATVYLQLLTGNIHMRMM